jgi:hypothetical protein
MLTLNMAQQQQQRGREVVFSHRQKRQQQQQRQQQQLATLVILPMATVTIPGMVMGRHPHRLGEQGMGIDERSEVWEGNEWRVGEAGGSMER